MTPALLKRHGLSPKLPSYHRNLTMALEQTFRGYLAIPEKCGGPSWWELLGVPSAASEVQIKDAFREKAKTAHPDKGGSTDGWARFQEAYDQALAGFRK